MRRLFVCLAVAAILLAGSVAWAADAPEAKAGKKPKSQLWEFGGGVKLQGALRDVLFDQVLNRSGNPDGKNEFYIDAVLSLNLNIRISNTANFFVQLETQDDAFAFESHRVGDNNQIVTFKQGWLKVEEIVGSESLDLALKIGLMNVRFDTRNLGRDIFLLDATESENPFTGLPPLTAAANGTPSFQTHASAYVANGWNFSRNESFGGNAWVHSYMGQNKNSEAGGAMLTLNLGKDVLLDLGAITVMEGGLTSEDTNVFFFNFDFEFDIGTQEKGLKKGESFDDRSLINVIAVAFRGEHSLVADVGLGFDLLIDVGRSAELELYAEAHYQYGGKYYTQTDFSGATPDRVLIRHEAYGAYGGMRFKIKDDSKMHPYLDVSYWRLSGDNGEADEENRDFMSMENVDTLMILEGDELGYDIDCNYWAIKGEIGFHLPSSLNAIALRITGGAFWLISTPQDLISVNIDGGTGEYRTYSQRFTDDERKNLGIEVDVRVTWEVTEEAKIFLAGGMLFNSIFMQNLALLKGSTDPEDTTHCVLMGFQMKF